MLEKTRESVRQQVIGWSRETAVLANDRGVLASVPDGGDVCVYGAEFLLWEGTNHHLDTAVAL